MKYLWHKPATFLVSRNNEHEIQIELNTVLSLGLNQHISERNFLLAFQLSYVFVREV
jgi:hypothetical protein